MGLVKMKVKNGRIVQEPCRCGVDEVEFCTKICEQNDREVLDIIERGVSAQQIRDLINLIERGVKTTVLFDRLQKMERLTKDHEQYVRLCCLEWAELDEDEDISEADLADELRFISMNARIDALGDLFDNREKRLVHLEQKLQGVKSVREVVAQCIEFSVAINNLTKRVVALETEEPDEGQVALKGMKDLAKKFGMTDEEINKTLAEAVDENPLLSYLERRAMKKHLGVDAE